MFIRKYWIPLSVLLIAIAAVSIYWTQTRPPKEPIVIYKPVEPLPKAERAAEAPQGHVHADGDPFHAEPHEPIAEPSEARVSESKAESPPQPEHNKGAGNPPPFENIPVDLYDFEATKATMIENINFVKANWDPETFFDKDLGREMRRAYAIASSIANAALALTDIYTREQARELNVLYFSLSQMVGNAADEMLQR